jgi:cyclic beta-1,2-glucan synthetase
MAERTLFNKRFLSGRSVRAGFLTALFLFPVLKAAETAGWSAKDASGRGVFNIGAARGAVALVPDAGLSRDVLKLDYDIPAGAVTGVWTKGYPAGLTAEAADVVRVGARAADPAKAADVVVALEIKGGKGVQKVPVPVKGTWTSVQGRIDWALVGEFKEAVFVVTPVGSDRAGTVFLDIQFQKGPTVETAAAPGAVRLLDASGRGVFNIGIADGKIAVVADDKLKRDVLRMEYRTPASTVAGVWTKGYPALVSPRAVNGVRASVRTTGADQAKQIAVVLELKGSKDVQRVSVPLTAGWSTVQATLDWALIGDFKEAVFVVTPVGGNRQGVVSLDLEFAQFALAKRRSAGVVTMMDARGRGAFNIGAAEAKATAQFNEKIGRDVARLDFVIPSTAAAGLWTKEYPASLTAASVNAVAASVRATDAVSQQVAVILEIKGAKDIQRIPLPVKSGWTRSVRAIDWDRLGEMKEAVFVVTPLGGRRAGTLLLDLEFSKEDPAGLLAPRTGVVTLLDGKERGAFNAEGALGTAVLSFAEDLKKDVVRFDFATPSGTSAGLWAKAFPSALSPDKVRGVRAAVETASADAAAQIEVLLELKGEQKSQLIPLNLRAGWADTRADVDWPTLGSLREAVFVVTPLGADRRGTLRFDLDFTSEDPTLLSGPVTLLSAEARGAFNIGAAEGLPEVVVDPDVKRDVVRLAYTAPAGTAVGLWTKDYPAGLTRRSVNTVRVAVKGDETLAAAPVEVTVELKGSAGVQRIPFRPAAGWTASTAPIDWGVVGTFREAVFVVAPVGGDRRGVLSFELEFFQDAAARRSGTSLWGRILLLFGFAAALSLVSRLLAGRASEETKAPAGWGKDFLVAGGVVAAVAAVVGAHGAGDRAGGGWVFLGVTGLATLSTVFFRGAFIGRGPAAGDVFWDTLLLGLTVVLSSAQTLWQSPTGWAGVFLESRLASSLTVAAYLAITAASLANHRAAPRRVIRAVIAGVPLLFGLLFALENPELLRGTANLLTAGALSTWPWAAELLGRLGLVFLFNELVINALALIAKGRGVRAWRAHGVNLFVSLAVVLSPSLADHGSTAAVASMSPLGGALAATLSAMISQAGLWMEVYMLTGLMLDGAFGYAPSQESVTRHTVIGLQKGMAFSGLFIGLLHAVFLLLSFPAVQRGLTTAPLTVGLLTGALLFPLGKTVVESFDGSMSFFRRLVYSYKNGTLYFRGAVAGLALSHGLSDVFFNRETSDRLAFGLLAGLLASVGVSVARDMYYGARNQGRLQPWRQYLVDGLLGGFVGALLAFYMDATQVPAVLEKIKMYLGAGFEPRNYTIYALLSKWGRVDLGSFTGGVKLFYNEALAGVITWAIAAWLFAINRVFMQAYFQRDKAPLRHFFSPVGGRELMVNTLHVVRWGLWMAPIINTGLRMMGEATWYNQDGAVRSLIAVYKNLTLSNADFQAWSLGVFVTLLASDWVRVLIWLDHMGLRVATLVNLSFIGMERLDNRVARFIGGTTAQKCIPEGIKRFTTWAPLLIPFYIPRGDAWDYAWNKSIEMQNAAAAHAVPLLSRFSGVEWTLLAAFSAVVLAGALALRRAGRGRVASAPAALEVGNRAYRVVLKPSGEIYSEVSQKGYDLTRRSYDAIDPCGRALFLVDAANDAGKAGRAWPVLGNSPRSKFEPSTFAQTPEGLRVTNTAHGLKAELTISLADDDTPAEIWTLTLENPGNDPRQIKAVPYLEWVLDRPESDKGHTQYLRLFPEMEYAAAGNALLVNQRKTKTWGFVASEAGPEGFHTSRMDFIGRGRSLWSPRLLETLDFLEPRDTAPYPTFDPIGAILVGATLPPRSSQTFKFLVGFARNRDAALETVKRFLSPQPGLPAPVDVKKKKKKKNFLIGHGEILPGTPQPYSSYAAGGNTLVVHTPFTPRPFDHALSNGKGHYVMVTNRGLHTTSNGNSQQNAITPDWPDTVTREVPAEAIYLYDVDQEDWLCPTHHPLNDPRAEHSAEFSVDGTALFRMSRGTISTELTVFVPPHETVGVYLLTVKNRGAKTRRLRVAPYFQISLVGQSESRPRPLLEKRDEALGALYFENPTNDFRYGPAFASMSLPIDRMETRRGRFLGAGRWVDRPYMVEKGEPDASHTADGRAVAAFLGSIEIPAQGEQTVAVVLGQTDNRAQAEALVRKYKSVDVARASLDETRRWWLNVVNTLKVETNTPEFDQYQNWLKYQAIAERLWARRGFYQTSGAFGFRDQLQDSVNLIWVDPALARKQILLHASQQFLEGDVVHWFHTLHDGRTAFSNRSHASDNLLWLAWAAAEYTRLTGDEALLEEKTSYLRAETPFLPLPHNKHGWGTNYPRCTRQDTLYRHCLKAIDLVLTKRMGEHGLPLIATGDWNDGLDEIGSEGRGESVWLGFFLHYILKNFLDLIERKDGPARKEKYLKHLRDLEIALENTWRDDRYLRAIHDDGTEIGIKDSGVWEIDALTAAWAVYAGINMDRARAVFHTALNVLERDNVILLGWPALREDTKPYLGRSSHYPEGVRENGMYCHGVQWLVRAARLLAERFDQQGEKSKAKEYREIALRLWMKISPIPHVTEGEIEIYGGQPNKQSADFLTTFDQGRMIWHGYTGAAGWMLRQAMEGVVGASLVKNDVVLPSDLAEPRGALKVKSVRRDLGDSPLKGL